MVRAAARLACLMSMGCSGGQVVTLGFVSPRPYQFEAPSAVAELSAPDRTDNPTLTGDLLEIYFTSARDSGNGDLWFARRANADGPFETPVPLTALNTDAFETSSAISSDGLTLWFGSDRPGGLGGIDVWVSTRATRSSAWSSPVNVVALNSSANDIPRPPGQRGLVMPMASTRSVADNYQTSLATRPARGAPFEAPSQLDELAFSNRSTVDAFLSDDGLTLFYSSAPRAPADADGGAAAATSDLFVAWRRSAQDEFSAIQPLDDLNTAGDERDPWLTPDGKTLYFTSDRDGTLGIYAAAVKPR